MSMYITENAIPMGVDKDILRSFFPHHLHRWKPACRMYSSVPAVPVISNGVAEKNNYPVRKEDHYP